MPGPDIDTIAIETPEITMQIDALAGPPDLSKIILGWSEPAPDVFQCKCILCGFDQVWVGAKVLRKQPVLRCGRGHTLSVIVPVGVDPPKLKLAK